MKEAIKFKKYVCVLVGRTLLEHAASAEQVSPAADQFL